MRMNEQSFPLFFYYCNCFYFCWLEGLSCCFAIVPRKISCIGLKLTRGIMNTVMLVPLILWLSEWQFCSGGGTVPCLEDIVGLGKAFYLKEHAKCTNCIFVIKFYCLSAPFSHWISAASSMLASFPGVPIPIWRRGKKKLLVHTVVRMRLIPEKSRKMWYPGNFPCNGDLKILEFLQPQDM